MPPSPSPEQLDEFTKVLPAKLKPSCGPIYRMYAENIYMLISLVNQHLNNELIKNVYPYYELGLEENFSGIKSIILQSITRGQTTTNMLVSTSIHL